VILLRRKSEVLFNQEGLVKNCILGQWFVYSVNNFEKRKLFLHILASERYIGISPSPETGSFIN